MILATRYGTTDELYTLRRRFIIVLAWAGIIFGAIGSIIVLLFPLVSGSVDVPALVLLVAFVIANLICLLLTNRESLQLTSIGMIVTTVLTALIAPPQVVSITGFIAITAAAVLGGTPIFVISTVLILGKVGLEAVNAIQQNSNIISSGIYLYIVPLVVLTTASLVIRYFIWTAEHMVIDARRTASFLQASADIDKITARLVDLKEILNESVTLLRSRFRYDHIQVYLVTESDMTLVAAASAPGRGLLNRGYRVALGSRHAVDQVVLSGNPLLRNLPPSETAPSEDVFLDTRSQLVLPLRDGDRVIGALDIQSEEVNVFLQEDIQPLQVIGDLMATSVRNVRLYENQSKVADENKRLYEQSENNLREIERLNQELTRRGWQEYIRPLEQTPGVTLAEDRLVSDSGWTDALLQAQQERRPVSRLDGEQQVVAVPITLRGEVIGAIEVEPGGQASGTDAVEMVEAVAQRLAISLENARLYEETQKAAAQEQRINDIAARYQQVTTVDELLRVTLQELSETLGAQRGTIRLGSIQEVSPS